MRASTPRKRHNTKWRVTSEDPATIGPLLRKCGFLAVDTDPLEVRAHFDATGRPRRVHATYQGGWRATLVLRADGTYSLSQTITLVSRAIAR